MGNTSSCLNCGRDVEIPGLCDPCAEEERKGKAAPRMIPVTELNRTIMVLALWFEGHQKYARVAMDEMLRLQDLRGYRTRMGESVFTQEFLDEVAKSVCADPGQKV